MAALALVREDGRVLMQRRPEKAMHGGLWEFPGGKIESGETAQVAVLREISEELGIAIAPGDLQPVGEATAAMPEGLRWSHVRMQLFMARQWTGTATPLEGARLRWVRPEALHSLPMPPVDLPLSARLVRLLLPKTP